jgi:hypothetical protein
LNRHRWKRGLSVLILWAMLASAFPLATVHADSGASSNDLLFQDDFAAGIAAKWDAGGTGGNWSQATDNANLVMQGVSTATSGNPGNKRAKSSAWLDFSASSLDYTLSFKAHYTGGTASGGTGEAMRVLLRYNPSTLYYYYFEFNQKNNTVSFWKYTGSYVSVNAAVPLVSILPGYNLSAWHQYDVAVYGNTFRLYIDGTPVMTTSPDSDIQSGTIGFAHRNSTVKLDDVRVTASNPYDTSGPVIAHTPVNVVDAVYGALIQAVITGSSPIAASVYYRYGSGTSLPFSSVSMTQEAGDVYTAAVPGTDEQEMQYYIEAADAAGRRATSLFADSFDRPEESQELWTNMPSEWGVATDGEGHSVLASLIDKKTTFLSNPSGVLMNDYDLDFRARLSSKNSGYANFYFRANGGDYYAVEARVNGTNSVLFKMHYWQNDLYQANLTANVTYEYDPAQWHRYKIRVRGNTFALLIDDQPVISATDGANRYTSGVIGFKSFEVGLVVDAVTVTYPAAVSGSPALSIWHQPQALAYYNTDIPVAFSVSDTGAPVTAAVYYRYGEGAWETLIPPATGSGGRSFTGLIPGTNKDDEVRYYITASDGKGGEARYPPAPSGDIRLDIQPVVPYAMDWEQAAAGTVPAGWTATGANVKTVSLLGGNKVLEIDGTGGVKFTDPRYANLDHFKLSFKAKYERTGTEGYNTWRLRYRAVDESNNNSLEWGSHNSKYFLMRKTALGGNYYLANYVKSLLNDWHDYELQISGITHKLFIDGSEVTRGEDSDPLRLEKGYLEFGVVGGIRLQVDDLSLTPLSVPAIVDTKPADNYTGIYSLGETPGLDISLSAGAEAAAFGVAYQVYRAEGDQSLVLSGEETYAVPAYGASSHRIEFLSGLAEIGTYDVKIAWTVNGIPDPGLARTMRMAVVRQHAPVSPADLEMESKFGFNTHYQLNWREDIIQGVRKTGARHHRSGLSWGEIDANRTDGAGNKLYDYGKTDELLSKISGYGFNQTVIMDTHANSAYRQGSPNTPVALDALASFMSSTVNRYKSSIRYWEMPNEPELVAQPYLPADYALMQRVMYQSMKQADPNAVLIAGDHTSSVRTILPGELELGSYDAADAYSYHPYIYNAMPDDNIQSFVNDVKGLVNAYGGWKDYYLTEGGWPTAKGGYPSVSEQVQRDYVVRAFLNYMILDQVKAYEYYDYRNDGTDEQHYDIFWGIVDNDGRPKLAYAAVNQLMTELNHAEYLGRLNSSDSKAAAHMFLDDGEPILVAWRKVDHKDNPAVVPPTSTLTIPADGSQLTVTDINGKESTVPVAGGSAQVVISGSPVYLKGFGAGTAFSAAAQLLEDKYADAKVRLEALQNPGNQTETAAVLTELGQIRSMLIGALEAPGMAAKAAGLQEGIEQIYALMKDAAGLIEDGVVDRRQGNVALEALYNQAETASKSLIYVKYLQSAGASATDYGAAVAAARSAYQSKKGPYGLMPVSTAAVMRMDRYARLADARAASGLHAESYVYNLLAKSFAGAVTDMVAAEPVTFAGLLLSASPSLISSEAGFSSVLNMAVANKTGTVQQAVLKLELPAGWTLDPGVSSEQAITLQPDETMPLAWNIPVPAGVAAGLYEVNALLLVGGSEVQRTKVRLQVNDAIGAEILPLTTGIGDIDTITVKLKGTSINSKSGSVVVKGPDGATLTPVNGNTFTGLLQGQERTLSFVWTNQLQRDFNEYPVDLTVVDSATGTPLFHDPAMPLDFIVIGKAAAAPVIDGSLSDWTDAYPIHLRGKNRNSTGVYDPANVDAALYLKWDAANIHIAVKVKDNIHKNSETAANLWKNDSVQVAFDPLDNKGTAYGPDDMEWGFAMKDDAAQTTYIFKSMPPNPSGDVSGQVPFQVVRDEAAKTTFYEWTIPSSKMAGLPLQAGGKIGFNAAVNDADYQNGRDNFIFWTKGLADSKNPGLFDSFMLLDDGE